MRREDEVSLLYLTIPGLAVLIVWLLLHSGAPPFTVKIKTVKRGSVLMYRDAISGVPHVCEAASEDLRIVMPYRSKIIDEFVYDFVLITPPNMEEHKGCAICAPIVTGSDRDAPIVLPPLLMLEVCGVEPYLKSVGFTARRISLK